MNLELSELTAVQISKRKVFGTCHTSMIFWLQLISLLIVDSVHFIRRLPRYPLEIRSSHHISERNELILERVAFSKQQH